MRINFFFAIIFLLLSQQVLSKTIWEARGFKDKQCYRQNAIIGCKDCLHCKLEIFPNSTAKLIVPLKGYLKDCHKDNRVDVNITFQFFEKPLVFAITNGLLPLSKNIAEVLQGSEPHQAKKYPCSRGSKVLSL